MEPLTALFNRDYSKQRLSNLRRTMFQRMRSSNATGKGNKAWSRTAYEGNDCIVWPEYCQI